jgi:hypothetical protein
VRRAGVGVATRLWWPLAYEPRYSTMYLAINARGGEPTQTYATKVDVTASATASANAPTTASFPTFFGAADASFGDDPKTRRSSARYIFMLYGMPIN